MATVRRGPTAGAVVLATLLVASIAAVAPVEPARAGASPELIGCDRAGARVELTADAVLDPTCTYAGFDVSTSGVTLDCRGARIAGPTTGGTRGILVSTPVDVALRGVTIRSCEVEGFLNGIRVTRDGFRTLPDGAEFEHPTSDIVIEDSEVHGSRGVGVFVDGYVSGVTIRRTHVHDAGSSGIYLDGGSRENVIEDNEIVDNGRIENGPDGQTFELGGTTVWFWGTGREGVSIDGSSDNVVRDNRLQGNSAGGIFVYKNCGEHPDRPAYFERRDPSDRNRIEGNRIADEHVGVWIGSRMGENTLPMACTDPAYVDEPARRVVLDRARQTIVRGNELVDVTYGIRVEDDGTVVEGNRFRAATPDHHAVLIGTPDRTEVLGLPVRGTRLLANESEIAGNPNPFRWVHGEAQTEVAGNLAEGVEVGICEAPPVPREQFIFVLAVAAPLPGGGKPPTPDLTREVLGALAPCPTAPAIPDPPDPPVDPSAPSAPAAVPVAATATYTG